jgi:hypothetical protein
MYRNIVQVEGGGGKFFSREIGGGFCCIDVAFCIGGTRNVIWIKKSNKWSKNCKIWFIGVGFCLYEFAFANPTPVTLHKKNTQKSFF